MTRDEKPTMSMWTPERIAALLRTLQSHGGLNALQMWKMRDDAAAALRAVAAERDAAQAEIARLTAEMAWLRNIAMDATASLGAILEDHFDQGNPLDGVTLRRWFETQRATLAQTGGEA